MTVPAELLSRQRDRTIRAILQYKDEVVDPHLPKDVAVEFRGHILDSLNHYADFIYDLFKSSCHEGEGIQNEYVLERLEEIHKLVSKNGHRP